MRDFRAELAEVRCWDQEVEDHFQAQGVPLADCVLQNREELIRLCEFIEVNHIRSYLEIGVWTGALITVLDSLFSFSTLAACDIFEAENFGLEVGLPAATQVFRGDSHSEEYRAWRQMLGHVDLVLIDGDHSFDGVSSDFRINREFPHRFLALHDIAGANQNTADVGRFWRSLGAGSAILEPHLEVGSSTSTMGIGIVPCSTPIPEF